MNMINLRRDLAASCYYYCKEHSIFECLPFLMFVRMYLVLDGE